MSVPNHYQILAISTLATREEIKKAYRALARKYHPDKNLDNPKSTEYFQQIQMAYEVLYDVSSRKRYDQSLRQNGNYDPFSVNSIVNETDILKRSTDLVQYIKSHRQINADALTDYILAMLNKEHSAMLLRNNNDDVNNRIIYNVLSVSKMLNTMRLFRQIYDVLLPLAESNNDVKCLQALQAAYNRCLRLEQQQQLVTVFTIFLVVILFIITIIFFP